MHGLMCRRGEACLALLLWYKLASRVGHAQPLQAESRNKLGPTRIASVCDSRRGEIYRALL